MAIYCPLSLVRALTGKGNGKKYRRREKLYSISRRNWIVVCAILASIAIGFGLACLESFDVQAQIITLFYGVIIVLVCIFLKIILPDLTKLSIGIGASIGFSQILGLIVLWPRMRFTNPDLESTFTSVAPGHNVIVLLALALLPISLMWALTIGISAMIIMPSIVKISKMIRKKR
jgi:hypothetical protein